MLDQIINPSKVINDQFSAVKVLTEDGDIYVGVVVNLNGDSMTINTDLTDPNARVNVDRKQIEQMVVSDVSPMPQGLINQMTTEEIFDLTAYVLSGGGVLNADYFK